MESKTIADDSANTTQVSSTTTADDCKGDKGDKGDSPTPHILTLPLNNALGTDGDWGILKEDGKAYVLYKVNGVWDYANKIEFARGLNTVTPIPVMTSSDVSIDASQGNKHRIDVTQAMLLKEVLNSVDGAIGYIEINNPDLYDVSLNSDMFACGNYLLSKQDVVYWRNKNGKILFDLTNDKRPEKTYSIRLKSTESSIQELRVMKPNKLFKFDTQNQAIWKEGGYKWELTYWSNVRTGYGGNGMPFIQILDVRNLTDLRFITRSAANTIVNISLFYLDNYGKYISAVATSCTNTPSDIVTLPTNAIFMAVELNTSDNNTPPGWILNQPVFYAYSPTAGTPVELLKLQAGWLPEPTTASQISELLKSL